MFVQHHALVAIIRSREKKYFDSNLIQKRKIGIVAMFSRDLFCSGRREK